MNKTALLPRKVLSGSALKLLAMLTMLVDHIAGVVLVRHSQYTLFLGPLHFRPYYLMRYIGRLAFPIYCFLLVEGFLHTHDRRRYALRLALFALLSELPWNLSHGSAWLFAASQNVFFTLLLGFLGLCFLERLEQGEDDPVPCAVALLALLISSFLLKADYGSSGFGLILCLYLLRDRPLPQALVGTCLLPSTWKGGLAFLPLNLYNGERGFVRGKALQWGFYAFYPLHLAVLYLVRRSLYGF